MYQAIHGDASTPRSHAAILDDGDCLETTLIGRILNHFTYKHPHQADLRTSVQAYEVTNLFSLSSTYILNRGVTFAVFFVAFG
jgi:hypothetical protein